MRFLIDLCEALSKHSTVPPDWMAQRESTPIGKVLFHGTPIAEASNIIKTNVMYTGANWRGEGDRVPLTRNYKVAYENFGKQSDFSDYPTVFVLSWPLLARDYRIIPHRDWDANGKFWTTDEEEEAVYGDIRPLSKYLISINVEPQILQAALNDEELMGWIVEERQFAKTIRGAKNMLLQLAHHPKLNVWQP